MVAWPGVPRGTVSASVPVGLSMPERHPSGPAPRLHAQSAASQGYRTLTGGAWQVGVGANP